MCGRYTVGRSGKVVSKVLGRKISGEVHLPAYNASPGQYLPVILDAQPQLIVPALWGMRPTSGRLASRLMINARAETVHQRPMFRDSLRSRRCLVIADGFYEWQKVEGAKQPYRIVLKTGDLFSFAGIWVEIDGHPCYVILTTDANSVTRTIHDRMPVILEESECNRWLDRDLGVADVLALLDPYPESEMISYPVSREVNNSRNDGPWLIEALNAERN